MHTSSHKGMQIPLKQYGCELYIQCLILNLGRCTIVIDTVFLKFEYPCETRLPGSMGDPILNKSYVMLIIQITKIKQLDIDVSPPTFSFILITGLDLSRPLTLPLLTFDLLMTLFH